MLNNIAIYAIVGLVGVCTVLFFVAKHFYKKYKTEATEHYYLRSMYNSLEINYKALQEAIQSKKEAQDENSDYRLPWTAWNRAAKTAGR